MDLKIKLTKEVKSFVATDELIALNKRHQKLSDLHDKYDELIEIVKSFESLLDERIKGMIKTQNFVSLKDSKKIQTLEKLQNGVIKEMRKISEDSNKGLFLLSMVKGAMVLKALKKVA